MDERKSLIRIANRIQDALKKLQNRRYVELLSRLENFSGQLQEFDADSRKLGKALKHKWYAAARRYKTRIARSLNDISYALQRNRQLMDVPEKDMPKLFTLVAELEQLEQDCGPIEYDSEKETISIVTESIELEEIYFGPFKIELHLTQLEEIYKNSPYYVIALDPNPAAADSNVTHPHVSSEKVCEGDGSVIIRTALEQGRLSDFFTIVTSILNTYNPDSPYVSLSDWDGTPCYDCGYTMSSDNSYFCPFCDCDFCEECSTYCISCNETICMGCAGECPVCGERVCKDCVQECVECKKLCCKECMDENLCSNCIEERETENEEQENAKTETGKDSNQSQSETGNLQTQSGTEVQPDSMGEAAVLQGQG